MIMLKITSILHVDYTMFEARFISKFRALFEHEITPSDQVRYNTYDMIKSDFWKNIIPNGPIGKSVDIISYFGRYTDTPLTFLIDVFGSILAIAIILFVGYKSLKSFLISLFLDDLDETFIVCALMSPLLILSLFIDGAFLVHLNYAFVTGFCLSGYFYSNNKMRKVVSISE